MALRIFGGAGGEIRSHEDWRSHGAPKGGDRQWKEMRSAYELARAWCGGESPAAPADFTAMLTAHPLLGDLVLTEGYAEHETQLGGEVGGPRNHDLLLVGKAARRLVVVGVEGKADEQFDRPLQERWEEAQRTLAAGKPTRWPERVARLAAGLLGVEAVSSDGGLNPALADVPYQLLSALAGTLIEADERGAGLAVFVVHVFTSRATRPDRVARNQAALVSFIRRLAHDPDLVVRDGVLYGPFAVPGARGVPAHIPVLVGETVTMLDPSR
jgi:hypothetical protein